MGNCKGEEYEGERMVKALYDITTYSIAYQHPKCRCKGLLLSAL